MTTPIQLPPDKDIVQAVATLRLLADRTRLMILAMIEDCEMSVTSIAEALDRPTPAVSQHLAKLRTAGLVTSRREGTTIFYSQRDPHVRALVQNVFYYAEHSLYSEPPHHSRASGGPAPMPHGSNRDLAAPDSSAA